MQNTENTPKGPENLILVSVKTDVIGAVERAVEAIKKHDFVIFSALNSGISKLILIAEITKLKIDNLHQLNHLETITFDEKEGQQYDNERPRLVTRLKVEIWNKKPENKEKLFYQAPYDSKHLEALRSKLY